MRKYPQPSDYQGAIQNPKHVFAEPELQACTVRKNAIGLPAVSAGGFALSFSLEAPTKQRYVVRCFKADSSDRQTRYAAISRFLNDNPQPIFLDVDYLDRGILVNGEWYPIVKMPLVDGMTFHRYIEGEITARHSIADLPGKFRRLVDALEKCGAAHGDLQHGNIMVQQADRSLVLIDYDGMYVPPLKGRRSAESGNASYQHPQRDDQFGPDLDRFSALVIDMALRALTANPGLWAKYSNGDNMLFRQDDFENPDKSKLLRELESVPDLRAQVATFRTVCKGPLETVPRLSDFVSGRIGVVQPAPVNWLPPVPKKRQAVLDAHNRDELLKHIGEQVTVVGQIADVKEGTQYRGLPYVFLNFGSYLTSQLTLVIWSEELDLFKQQQKQPRNYVGRWVQVNGMLTSYAPGGRRAIQPQIMIDVPTQIEVLAGGEAQARELLAAVAAPRTAVPPMPAPKPSGMPAPPGAAAVPPAVQPARPARSIDADLNRLYGATASPMQPSAAPGSSSSTLSGVQPNTQPRMAALGIYFMPPSMHFGRLPSDNGAARQLRIMNTSAAPVTVSIKGMPPFLTSRQDLVSCPAKSFVDIDVQLDAGQIPAGKLVRAPAGGQGPAQQSLLKDAWLLMQSAGTVEMVPVEVTVVPPGIVRTVQPPPAAMGNSVQPPVAAQPARSAPTGAPSGAPSGAAVAAHSSHLPAAPSRAPAPTVVPTVVPTVQKSRDKKLIAASWIVSATVFLIAIYFRFPDAGAQIVRAATSGAYFRTEAAQPPLTPVRPTPPVAASPGIPAPSAADATQDVAAPFTEAESAASVCPEDLPVELVQPQYILTTDTSRFVWHTADALPPKCRFQIKLWREGRPRVTVSAQDAVLGGDGDYELMITLSTIFSSSELEPGEFSWTLEVAPADASGQALATAAEPVTFSWVPGTPTETP